MVGYKVNVHLSLGKYEFMEKCIKSIVNTKINDSDILWPTIDYI